MRIRVNRIEGGTSFEVCVWDETFSETTVVRTLEDVFTVMRQEFDSDPQRDVNGLDTAL